MRCFVPIEIYCARCGQSLPRRNVSVSYNNNRIEVSPCGHCADLVREYGNNQEVIKGEDSKENVK